MVCESMNGLDHSGLVRCGTAFCWVGNGSEQVARTAIVNLRHSTLLVNSFVEF